MTTPNLSKQNASPAERLVFGSLGASMIVLSLTRTDRVGTLLKVGGTLLLSGAAMGKSPYNALAKIRRTKDNMIQVQQAVTVQVPVEEVYTFWRNFENLPRFMHHLEKVEVKEDGTSHWVAKAPAGMEVSWDARTTEDVPNERIGWKTLEGSQIPNEGVVEFRAAPGDRGTEIRVNLQYHPPAGTLGAGVARLFGEEPSQQVAEDLRRLKRLMEVGTEPTTEGQSAGKGHAIAKLFDNRRTS